MSLIRARVKQGRLVTEERVDLPEGTEVKLAIVDAPDDLDDEERARLHRALEEGMAEVDAGRSSDAVEVLARLRSR